MFLAELVALRPSIVVAGTHGKGTTAAMIAYCLRETGGDPAWLIGAPVPQLGANAGAGEGWLVVEGDESDRTVFGLEALIGVITNVEFDHHSEFGSLGELEAAFADWERRAGAVVRDAPAYDGPLALPGAHNRANAGSALAALELAGLERDESPPRSGASLAPAGASRSARLARSRSSTTTPTTPTRSKRRSPPPVRRSRAGGCACSSSRTSSRAPATSRPRSVRPSPPPTTWS